MILFLNFAPIEFLGGAEQWIYQTAQHIHTKEKTVLLSVSPTISNLYSRVVLKRSFDKRVTAIHDIESHSLTLRHFLPFTREYSSITTLFDECRFIYIRYELPEVLIALYFGGFPILKKLIAGLHSSILYQQPLTLVDHLHNIIYGSWFSKIVLRKCNKVHVINHRDEKIIKEKFHVQQVIYIPTCVDLDIRDKNYSRKQHHKSIVLFIGELTMRKGVDILLDVIKRLPENLSIHIAGNGPMEKQIKEAATDKQDIVFYGHLNKKSLYALYEKADVLFLPSRAEGFPLVFHEAMAHGLRIVDSPFCNVGLPGYIEKANDDNSITGYIALLSEDVPASNGRKIQDYYKKHFYHADINKQIDSTLFEL